MDILWLFNVLVFEWWMAVLGEWSGLMIQLCRIDFELSHELVVLFGELQVRLG